MGMRIYVPITPIDLRADEISPRRVHGVTPAEQLEFLGEDLESLELVATLYAADDSMELIAQARETGSNCALRRLVAVGMAPREWIAPADASASEELPVTALALSHALPWAKIESIHVDEPGQEQLLERAIAGDEAAFEAAGDIDLLWYDVTERAELAQELGE